MAIMVAASRHVLLAEMLLGLVTMTLGISVAAEVMSLSRLLKLGWMVNADWILASMLGFAQAAISSREWFLGRGWELVQIQRSVRARWIVALLAGMYWLQAMKGLLFDPPASAVVLLLIVAPAAIALNGYAVLQNRKVWIALNPDCLTDTMTFDRY
jgi:hypothetical protein